ncbi:uncharacterized protein LOC123320131 [Coccinella septempunctata]|uniref:uncharacterized protein LOC123320131 n=1 Tax=Coccinella septempunctata TaxID=41139 RepID=UPI001D063D66|nr:uncharacterized protein LOC123320131 [Coccinella septempunctata]
MKTSSMLEYIAHMKLYPTHMNSPSIDRPGQCNAGNRSTRNNNERKHIQQTLNGKGKQPVANISAIHNQSYTCIECTFSTPDMRTFVNHKFETHKHRWFKCPKCRVCSSSTNASMEHFRKNPSHLIPYVEEKTPDNHSDNLIIGPRREKQHRYKSDENLIIEVKKEGDKEKIVITPKSYFFKNRDKREITFYCEVCKFNASTYKKVLLHRKTIHNLDMKCSGCSHTTSTICELKEHIVQNPTHMTEYVSCNLCNFGTYDQLVLISHKESEHFRNVQAVSE